MKRKSNGQFAQGNKGSPGRPSKEREVKYYEILVSEVTEDKWRNIIKTAIRQAENGDYRARDFLSDRIMGKVNNNLTLRGDKEQPIQIDYNLENLNDEQLSNLLESLGTMIKLLDNNEEKS